MSQWPPIPPQSTPPDENKSSNDKTASIIAPQGQEWALIQKLLLSSIEEQKKVRRWSIFFRVLGFISLLLFFALLGKGCSSEPKISINASMPHLAVVDLQGEISAESGANSKDIISALNQAFEAQNSKAIVLNINSPGGSPVESDNIWLEIKHLQAKYKDKKVYAVVGDVAASGAYYVASSADEVWVNPSSLVGSIGVIMPNYGVSDLAKRLGVEDRTLTAGKHKNILAMTRNEDPVEVAQVQSVLDNVHEHFINAVKQGRGNRLKENPDMFSGLFWSGEQAVGLGLADKQGNIQSLARQLHIDYQVDYSISPDPLASILGRLGVTLNKQLGESIGQGFAKGVGSSLNQPMVVK